MRRRLFMCVLLAVLAPGLWSVAGCQDGGSDDAGPPDVLRDDIPPVRDLRSVDLLRPDMINPACGGSRVLDPREVLDRSRSRPCGKGCRQVTFGGDANEFDVAGNMLVYSAGGGIDRDVYFVDLIQDKEWLIHKSPAKRPGCFAVSTNGKKLAYSCIISPKPGDYTVPIQLYDPTTKIEEDVGCYRVESGHGQVPLEFGFGTHGIITEMSLTSGKEVDAFFFGISDRSLKNVSQRKGGVWYPRIWGTQAVWTQAMGRYGESGYTQIILYDTKTSLSRLVAPFAANQYWARIKGDKVVWMDNRNSSGSHLDPKNSDIYIHDLKSGKTQVVSTHMARQDWPDVEDDLVVWEDWRNNKSTITPRYGSEYMNSDIYIRDMKTKKEVQLSSFATPGYKDLETKPRIVGRRVFYKGVNFQSKRGAVFMIDLDEFTGL